MPKTEDEKYKSLSHQTNAIVLAVLVALIAGVFFLSTEKGMNLLGFDPDATGSSANQEKFRKNDKAIKGSYIVVLEENERDVPRKALGLAEKYQGKNKHVYESSLKGFATEMSEANAIEMSKEEGIAYIEEDSVIETQTLQSGAPWGISRVDNQDAYKYPLDSQYDYDYTGQGVNVYVIDTGIDTSHPEFEGRAFKAVNTSGDNRPITDSCNGHGTGVAGVIGSKTYGVAKQTRIYDVQYYPCSGTGAASGALAAIDWVTKNASRPAVVNMSFGTSTISSTLDSAVQSLVQSGLTAVVAAGNYSKDACTGSPANVKTAITVGAITQSDSHDPSTNYGGCVDFFSPGVLIKTTWLLIADGTRVNQVSGTSFAAPHASGAAALFLQQNPTASPSQVHSALVDSSTLGMLYNIPNGSPNKLLYTSPRGYGSSPAPTPSDTIPPQITISSPKTGSLIPKKGQLKLNASASDSSGIGTITLSLNGTVVKVCTGTTSCSANVNAGGILSGNHTVTVTATDKAVPPNANSTSVNISKP